MKTWDDWCDFEVNKAIFPFTKDFGKCKDIMQKNNPNRSTVMWGDGANWFEFDGCNSWADMGQIIGDRKISLHWDWEVMNECSAIGSTYVMRSLGLRQINHEYTSKNPLRAAAIVFLMMNGVNPE